VNNKIQLPITLISTTDQTIKIVKNIENPNERDRQLEVKQSQLAKRSFYYNLMLRKYDKEIEMCLMIKNNYPIH
jgi:hypothetical protein